MPSNAGFGDDGTRADPRIFLSAGVCILAGTFLLIWGSNGNRVTCAVSASFSLAHITWAVCCGINFDDDWVTFGIIYGIAGVSGFLAYTRSLWRLGWVLLGANGGAALATAVLCLKPHLLFSNVEGRVAVIAVCALAGCGAVYFTHTHSEGVAACTSVAGSWLFFFGLDMIINETDGLVHGVRALYGASADSKLGANSYDPPLLTLIFIGCALLFYIFGTLLQFRLGNEPFIRSLPLLKEHTLRSKAFGTMFDCHNSGLSIDAKTISGPLEADEKLAAQLMATYAGPIGPLLLKQEGPFTASFPQSTQNSQSTIPHSVPLPRPLHFSPSSEKLRREIDEISAFTQSRRNSEATKWSTNRSSRTTSIESSSSKASSLPSYSSLPKMPKPARTRPRYEITPIRPQPAPIQAPMRRVSAMAPARETLSDRATSTASIGILVRDAFAQANARISHATVSTDRETIGRFAFEEQQRKSAWADVWSEAERNVNQ